MFVNTNCHPCFAAALLKIYENLVRIQYMRSCIARKITRTNPVACDLKAGIAPMFAVKIFVDLAISQGFAKYMIGIALVSTCIKVACDCKIDNFVSIDGSQTIYENIIHHQHMAILGSVYVCINFMGPMVMH